jgi:cell cycle arrest protein BUB2
MPSPPPPEPPRQAHALITELQAPPSPRTHRALRRLQSAHALGARAGIVPSPSLISQQRWAEHRSVSPTRAAAITTTANAAAAAPASSPGPITRSPQRGRANSDATLPQLQPMGMSVMSRRSGTKKPVFSHGHLSLQQIIREGPTDGDFLGALESARWKVVDEGVKSAEDGMVSAN